MPSELDPLDIPGAAMSSGDVVRPTSRRKIVISVITLGFLCVVGFYGYHIVSLRDFAAQSKDEIGKQLEEARRALHDLDPVAAQNPLRAIDQEIRLVQDEANRYGLLSLARLWGSVAEKFQTLPNILQNLTGVSGTAIHLSEDVAYLKEHAVLLMMNGHGQELLERLNTFSQKLTTLDEYVAEIGDGAGQLDEETIASLTELRGEIARNREALAALINLLSSPTPKHFLVLFQNPSEMRPSGGFIGSYADITVQSGNVTNIDVRDIYDPDGQFDGLVVPPEPLQYVTKKWAARDANWFFDFPTSAKKVISFMNQSKIYSEQSITFAGALALNTNVLESLIALAGPIELPEYNLTITPENFLPEIQREVESGEDKKVNQPKKILQIITPRLLSALTSSGSGQQELMKRLREHINQKDIMLYLDDRVLERYLKGADVAGEVAALDETVASEYLAVVNTNLGGGKTDAVVSQDINLVSKITTDGKIANTLTITRQHHGKANQEWWYRSTNRNYMQVMTPLGSELTTTNGRSRWPDMPKYNYEEYFIDSDVAAVEDSTRFLREFGVDRFIVSDKTTFAAWVNTGMASTTTYLLKYVNPKRLSLSGAIPYEFIFEKQSGASTTLMVTLIAPPGYIWKGNGSAELTYQSDVPPGRLRLKETLIPLK